MRESERREVERYWTEENGRMKGQEKKRWPKKKKGKEKEGESGMVWPTKIAHCFAGAFPFEHAGGGDLRL